MFLTKGRFKWRGWIFALAILVAGLAPWDSARAQMATDGTMGPAQVLVGPNFDIGAALGTQTGANLFHSFSQFNINTGESATFSGPASIDNVISRVTGGSLSNIDGLLSSTIPGADVFLINPSGILFGPNASLDVDGSFHASTADRVLFPDAGVFDATNPGATVLSVAHPSAFGFLDSNPASITVDRADLAVPAGATLSLVGGDISISGEGGEIADVILVDGVTVDDRRNFLRAPSGAVNLVSVASSGQVPVDGPLDLDAFAQLGSIRTDDLVIQLDGDSVAGTPGGALRIEGGQIVLNNTWIFSDSFGALDGGDFTIRGRDVTLTADRARFENDRPRMFFPFTTPTILDTASAGTGRGGDMTFEGNTITFDGGVGVFTETSGSGPIGDITITGSDVTLRFSASIGTFPSGRGAGGDVTVTADSFLIATDGAVRLTGINTDAGETGDAGDIFIQAKSVVLDGLQSLESTRFTGLFFAGLGSETIGSGDAGDVTIIADSVSFLGNAVIFSVTNGAGTGATVNIKARIVELREGGHIFAGTGGAGDAGSIIIEADRLSLSNDTSPFFSMLGTNTFLSGRGNPGDIILNVGTLELLTGGGLRTDTFAPSTGGEVRITADRVIISGDGTVFAIDEFPPFVPVPGNFTGIVTSGVGITSGNAGNITITAGSIEIGGGAVIASTVEGLGSGGAITLNSGALTITEAARLDASTTGPGAGGGIFITSDGTVVLDGPGSRLLTESFSTAPGAGTAGDIAVAAAELRLTNGAQISTESALADGGDIDLSLVSLLLVRDSEITTSVGTGTGAGGNITIDPVFVVLDGGTIQANAFGGPGGNIAIVAENFLASPDSLVEASSALGIAGTVAISAPETDLSAGVAVLTSTLMDAAQRLAKQCGARGGRTLASFVGKGRGALPVQPGAAMMAHYLGDAATKLGTLPIPAAAKQQPGQARVFLVPGTLQLSCVE